MKRKYLLIFILSSYFVISDPSCQEILRVQIEQLFTTSTIIYHIFRETDLHIDEFILHEQYLEIHERYTFDFFLLCLKSSEGLFILCIHIHSEKPQYIHIL